MEVFRFRIPQMARSSAWAKFVLKKLFGRQHLAVFWWRCRLAFQVLLYMLWRKKVLCRRILFCLLLYSFSCVQHNWQLLFHSRWLPFLKLWRFLLRSLNPNFRILSLRRTAKLFAALGTTKDFDNFKIFTYCQFNKATNYNLFNILKLFYN